MVFDDLVVVLDDCAIARILVEYLLGTEGIATRCFETPAEFFEYMKGHRPLCIILDINMPEMNGIQVLAALSEMDGAAPVIAVSAESNMTIIRAAIDCGARTFIPKPFDPERLLRNIREVLALSAIAAPA